jgi:hypothetical protein
MQLRSCIGVMEPMSITILLGFGVEEWLAASCCAPHAIVYGTGCHSDMLMAFRIKRTPVDDADGTLQAGRLAQRLLHVVRRVLEVDRHHRLPHVMQSPLVAACEVGIH